MPYPETTKDDLFSGRSDARNVWFFPTCRTCGERAEAGLVTDADLDGPVWTFAFYCRDDFPESATAAIFTHEAWAWRLVASLGDGVYRMIRDEEVVRKERK